MAKIPIQCDDCGHRAGVPLSFAGKKVRCLRCGNKVRVPVPKGAGRGRSASAERGRSASAERGRSASATRGRRSRRRITEAQAERSARQRPGDDTRRRAQAAIREILEEHEFAIEADDRGFLVDLRGVTFGLARTLVEEILEEAPGVRDVRLAGGLGECRMTVILKGAGFNPDDSFADENEETEVFHRKSMPAAREVDLDALVERATATSSTSRSLDPAQQLIMEEEGRPAPLESIRGPLPPMPAPPMPAPLSAPPEGDRLTTIVEKGQAFLERGDPENAVKLLEEAVRIDKDHAEAVYALATSYASIGEYDRARRAFRHFSKLFPDDADGHVMHAAAAVACDRLEDARAALVKAIQLDPNNAKAYRYAARLYERFGDPVRAQQFRQRYQQLKLERR